MWIEKAVSDIADFIVTNRQRAAGDKIGKPQKHLDWIDSAPAPHATKHSEGCVFS